MKIEQKKNSVTWTMSKRDFSSITSAIGHLIPWLPEGFVLRTQRSLMMSKDKKSKRSVVSKLRKPKKARGKK